MSGEKKFKVDELVPIYAQLKKDIKDMGCYEDFIECLKLYDKDENGMMQLGELQHSFQALGEFLSLEWSVFNISTGIKYIHKLINAVNM